MHVTRHALAGGYCPGERVFQWMPVLFTRDRGIVGLRLAAVTELRVAS